MGRKNALHFVAGATCEDERKPMRRKTDSTREDLRTLNSTPVQVLRDLGLPAAAIDRYFRRFPNLQHY